MKRSNLDDPRPVHPTYDRLRPALLQLSRNGENAEEEMNELELNYLVFRVERVAEYEFEETVSVLFGIWAYLMLGIVIGAAFCQIFGIVGG